MAIEIELKARLEQYEPVKQKLSLLGKFLYSYEKDDHYWIFFDSSELTAKLPVPADGARQVRVRRQKNMQGDAAEETVLVTYKIKQITDGIEINDEQEFFVSSVEIFEQFLSRVGMKLDIKKEKQGWAWQVGGEPGAEDRGSLPVPPILAELSMVRELGWFIELEIIMENRDEKTIAVCRKRLLNLLAELGIGPEKIEDRPYSLMLKEL